MRASTSTSTTQEVWARRRLPLVVATPVVLIVVLALLLATVAVVRGHRWQAVYHENFDADAATGRFSSAYGGAVDSYPNGWTDTTGTGTYRGSELVTVSDGTAKILLGSDASGAVSTALVPKLPTYGQVYGRYEVRFRADPVPGYKVAFLLWPDSERWPQDGEIDFPEGNLNGTIGAFAHHATAAGTQEGFPSDATFTTWHTALVEWTPGQVRFLLDGVEIGRSTTDVPAVSMHWVLQTETTGDQLTPGTQGQVEIDWLKVWSYCG